MTRLGFGRPPYDGWNGKGHSKRAASAPAGTGYADCSTMGVDEFPNDREPETEPAVSPALCAVCLLEPVKDVRQKLWAYAVTVIGNLNFRSRVHASHAHLYMPLLWCELHRVRKQI